MMIETDSPADHHTHPDGNRAFRRARLISGPSKRQRARWQATQARRLAARRADALVDSRRLQKAAQLAIADGGSHRRLAATVLAAYLPRGFRGPSVEAAFAQQLDAEAAGALTEAR